MDATSGMRLPYRNNRFRPEESNAVVDAFRALANPRAFKLPYGKNRKGGYKGGGVRRAMKFLKSLGI